MSTQYHGGLFLPISLDWYKPSPRIKWSNIKRCLQIHNSADDRTENSDIEANANNDCTFDIQCHKQFWWEDINNQGEDVGWRILKHGFVTSYWLYSESWPSLVEMDNLKRPGGISSGPPLPKRYTFIQLKQLFKHSPFVLMECLRKGSINFWVYCWPNLCVRTLELFPDWSVKALWSDIPLIPHSDSGEQ